MLSNENFLDFCLSSWCQFMCMNWLFTWLWNMYQPGARKRGFNRTERMGKFPVSQTDIWVPNANGEHHIYFLLVWGFQAPAQNSNLLNLNNNPFLFICYLIGVTLLCFQTTSAQLQPTVIVYKWWQKLKLPQRHGTHFTSTRWLSSAAFCYYLEHYSTKMTFPMESLKEI